MCGIAGGAWSRPDSALDELTLIQMTRVIQHRGPDGCGYYHSRLAPRGRFGSDAEHHVWNSHEPSHAEHEWRSMGAAFGHRRLSIIDLAAGTQPLSNEDGRIWITFNGEIYNYRELADELRPRHHFRTNSDTEVIVHLYEEMGDQCVQRLRGMFAFAIWDGIHERMLVARDRLGKKPLFYRADPSRIVFGSELKCLLQVPGATRNVDPLAIDDFLTYQYVPHPQCILEGVNKLPPGHCGVFDSNGWHVSRYWSPTGRIDQAWGQRPEPETKPTLSRSDAKSELRRLMTEAVRLRMRSDVPLGAFLSGGVDSTIVAGLMQSLSDQPVKTFCIGFPVREFDEREFARIAARHLKTEHHELVIEPSGLDILPKLIWHFDEPFADSSAIPTLYLSEMTREHVTVSLSGDGGDELFGGYDRYKAVEWGMAFDRWPGFLRAMVTSPVWQWLPTSSKQKSKRRRLKRLLEALGDEPRRRYLRWVSIFDDKRRAQLYSRDFLERLGDHDSAWFLLDAYRRAAGSDFVSQTMFADVETYLPCDILTKVDIASMAYALEVRCPFLDHEVVQFAARLPIEQKRRGGIGKRILRETFADLLPTAVTNRGKMGFGVPLAYWFRDELSDLIRGALLDRRSLDRGYFEPDQVRKLVEEHASGRWDHSYRLWSLLVLELWHRMYIDHDPPREAPAVKPRVPENAAVSGAT